MNPKTGSLANLMQAKREAGHKFTVMLGAGASLSSGVKLTVTLMQELLQRYGQDIPLDDIGDRFDELWRRTPEETRGVYLKPYLTQRPSPGYQRLAEIIKAGFIDVLMTFNYDNLVEVALQDAGLRTPQDYCVIIRGDHADDRVVSMMEAREPRIKVLKLHGSLLGGDTFLFSKEEMLIYPDGIGQLVKQLTRNDIIVCGYAFEDMCVFRSFSEEGESIYCVNPKGAPAYLKGFLVRRRSNANVIDKEDGKFDAFFDQLHQALLRKEPEQPAQGPTVNPFKFLDSYESAEKGWFFGRRALSRRVIRRIEAQCPAIHIVGPQKVGKTSFLRAGIIANLDPARYFPVYIRCTTDVEEYLPQVLRDGLGIQVQSGGLKTTLEDLARSHPERRVVLALDQFERVVRRFPDSAAGQRELSLCLASLCGSGCANLTVILSAVDDPQYLKRLIEQRADMTDVPRFEGRRVGRIVRLLAGKAGVLLDADTVRDMVERYVESTSSSSANPFTLAHIHAICHVLCAKPRVDLAIYQAVLGEHLASLDKAINQCDVMSFVEDCPLEEQRALLRNMLRIVSQRSKQEIAECLRDHFSELVVPRRPLMQRGGAAHAGN
jgi:hypothetical protein